MYTHTPHTSTRLPQGSGPARQPPPPSRGGYTGFAFDSTLGYPGEGPESGHFLLAAAHKASTRKKYHAAVRRFLDWLGPEDPATAEDMDYALVEWMHELYMEEGGRCRSVAEAAVCGIKALIPRLKDQLHGTRQALRGWRRLKPPTPFPPLTWDLTVLLAVSMAKAGWVDTALATLVAFDSYLRIGELCSLSFDDVGFASERRLGARQAPAAFHLRRTKTGPNRFAELRDPHLAKCLQRWIAKRRRGAKGPGLSQPTAHLVFGQRPSTFRRRFKRAAAAIGLSPRYVPHSLRHGGATRDHLAKVPIEEILRRGRWASTSSARHYIQSGAALLLEATVPPATRALAARLADGSAAVFSALFEQ